MFPPFHWNRRLHCFLSDCLCNLHNVAILNPIELSSTHSHVVAWRLFSRKSQSAVSRRYTHQKFKLTTCVNASWLHKLMFKLMIFSSFSHKLLLIVKWKSDKQAFNIHWRVTKKAHAMQQFKVNWMTQRLIRATNPEQCFNFSLLASNDTIYETRTWLSI